jgi:hypothetical protein
MMTLLLPKPILTCLPPAALSNTSNPKEPLSVSALRIFITTTLPGKTSVGQPCPISVYGRFCNPRSTSALFQKLKHNACYVALVGLVVAAGNFIRPLENSLRGLISNFCFYLIAQTG